jgi:cellobiose phosphorylase
MELVEGSCPIFWGGDWNDKYKTSNKHTMALGWLLDAQLICLVKLYQCLSIKHVCIPTR